MEIRVVGYIDEMITVDDHLWSEAKGKEQLEAVMAPHFGNLHVNLTFGEPGEFDAVE